MVMVMVVFVVIVVVVEGVNWKGEKGSLRNSRVTSPSMRMGGLRVVGTVRQTGSWKRNLSTNVAET